mgnify:CR=1 FL=1
MGAGAPEGASTEGVACANPHPLSHPHLNPNPNPEQVPPKAQAPKVSKVQKQAPVQIQRPPTVPDRSGGSSGVPGRTGTSRITDAAAELEKAEADGAGPREQTSRQFAMALGKDKPTASTDAACLWLGTAPAKRSRVGSDYQLELRPVVESVQPPPAPPPRCHCSAPAIWARERWFCASERSAGGCAFEAVPPPLPLSPLCECGGASTWVAVL